MLFSKSHETPSEGNIYADKSALILAWLLTNVFDQQSTGVREVAKELDISLGLVQRVFKTLVFKGFMTHKGLRTAKRFFLTKPKLLLESWLTHYDITKKCRMRTYSTGLENKEELIKILKKTKLSQKVALSLHTAAAAYGYQHTNLDTLELYILDPSSLSQIEHALALEPQERGYEVLLINPYYKALLKRSTESYDEISVSPILLTFLDLYHFPLRGQEQAEYIAEHNTVLKKLLTSQI